MIEKPSKNKKSVIVQYAPIIGSVLIASGLLLLLDQQLDTHWISISIPVIISLILTISGYITKKRVWLIPGIILLGLSVSLFVIFQQIYNINRTISIGLAIELFAFSWILLSFSIQIILKKWPWWSFLIGLISSSIGISFLLKHLSLLSFVFYVSLGIGISFLVWGWKTKKLGLLIPGLLISTIGIGIYSAWNVVDNPQGLMETGIMLVWFSLGWILITVVSRIIIKKFVWWPLIPGGVLAMVGSGLYIGGNPGNALGFFQNTGSIGLILFGVYLILLRYGMNK